MTKSHLPPGLLRALLTGIAALFLLLQAPAFAQQAGGQDTGGTAEQSDGGASGETAEGSPDARSQAAALVTILQDEGARNALISELERIADGAEPAAPAGSGAAAAPADGDAAPAADGGGGEDVITTQASENGGAFVRDLAEFTRATAEDLAASVANFGERLQTTGQIFSSLSGEQVALLLQALSELAYTILATVVVFLVLRWLARRLYRGMGRRGEHSVLHKWALIVASVIVDALVVGVAWAVGYAVALMVTGQAGSISLPQTLYLNAFFAIEMVKVVMRAVLSPATGALRPVNVSDRVARYLSRWFAVIISVLGYGQLLLLPVARANVSWSAGRAISAVVLLITVILLIWLVLANRRRFGAWLVADGQRASRGTIRRFVARNWHVPVLVAIVVLFFVVMVQPDRMLFPVLWGVAKVLIVATVGMIISDALTRAMVRGVVLPDTVKSRLPLLENRLNAFVPKALFVLRTLILLLVIGIALQAVGVFDLGAWFDSDAGARVSGTVVSALVMLLVAFLLWLALSSWVDYRLNPEFGRPATAREQTLLTLLRNAATIAIVVITLMFVLSEIGVDIAPLIASAGVLGLAIGFGAQKLVQDIITGIFIQFESAINVGDVVTVGGTTGSVERLTIRSVSLRDLNGVFHIIPFSSVDMVSNYMRGFSAYVCEMGIAYRESVSDAKQAMLDGFEELKKDPEHGPQIIGELEWHGLTAFGDSAIMVRGRIVTRPGKQWGLGRAYNEILKRIFDERGIEIPFPHQTLYFGEDKDGNAPAANIRLKEVPGPAVIDAKPEAPAAPGASAAPEGPARKSPAGPDMPAEEDEL
ncbi:mechanosensitive ion channel domain-containing protein [Oceanicella sp. SM1341]|uniref:mechanosensitive ion channel domain-containing protein n=1 Tax=Oceanicella sp. SM1341 TaxID=1548889 RepID=UPI000E4DF042|nr:mechanosensitive ion channel domain-containing protein [Oceanicella sp. SM1341]